MERHVPIVVGAFAAIAIGFAMGFIAEVLK